MSAPGWHDFDQAVVRALRAKDATVVDEAGMTCPLVSHAGHRLPWEGDDRRNGTEPHGEPPARFRASATYILVDPLDNIIVGRDLVRRIIAGEAGKAETGRLGNENSEDALSWNVFRSLQEADLLGRAAVPLAREPVEGSPKLYLWGCEITDSSLRSSSELSHALDTLEPTHRQQTEPDIMLRIPGWGWMVIEAKLNSGMPTIADSAKTPDAVEAWIARYADACPEAIDSAALRAADPKCVPGQLLRNVAVASRLRAEGERAHVVALVPATASYDPAALTTPFLTGAVSFGTVTWEALQNAVATDPAARALSAYMKGKSANLTPAFRLEA